MEQIEQQGVENKLPTKTKIAAWWMVGLGIYFAFQDISAKIFDTSSIFVSLLFILPPIILLLSSNEWAWFFSFVIIFFLFTPAIFQMLTEKSFFAIIHGLLTTAPIVFFIIDYKNFKRLSSRSQFKKASTPAVVRVFAMLLIVLVPLFMASLVLGFLVTSAFSNYPSEYPFTQLVFIVFLVAIIISVLSIIAGIRLYRIKK
ncbi:MAG: hypothetical protein PHF44_01615 [Candidatus Pacebacteria bacterium]|nr:hypothetical protein [Candidatus Paceibacterota bacterium]